MEQFHIQEFYGIQQQTDGALLPVTSAADARNMDTSDGNLSVANGYAKHLATILPGTDKILKLIVAREATEKWYVVTANKIYAFVDAATDRWDAIYTFSPALTSTQIDYVQTQIGTDDYLIIATGETQMIKVKISTNAAEVFRHRGILVQRNGIVIQRWNAHNHPVRDVNRRGTAPRGFGRNHGQWDEPHGCVRNEHDGYAL